MIAFVLDMSGVCAYSGITCYCRTALKWKTSDSLLWWVTASSRGLTPGTRRGFAKARRSDPQAIVRLEAEMEADREAELSTLDASIRELDDKARLERRTASSLLVSQLAEEMAKDQRLRVLPKDYASDPVDRRIQRLSDPPQGVWVSQGAKQRPDMVFQAMSDGEVLHSGGMECLCPECEDARVRAVLAAQRSTAMDRVTSLVALDEVLARQHAILNQLHIAYQKNPSPQLKRGIASAAARYEKLLARKGRN